MHTSLARPALPNGGPSQESTPKGNGPKRDQEITAAAAAAAATAAGKTTTGTEDPEGPRPWETATKDQAGAATRNQEPRKNQVRKRRRKTTRTVKSEKRENGRLEGK